MNTTAPDTSPFPRGSQGIGYDELEQRTRQLDVLVSEDSDPTTPLLDHTSEQPSLPRQAMLAPSPYRQTVLRSFSLRGIGSMRIGAAPGLDPRIKDEFQSAMVGLRHQRIHNGFLVDYSSKEVHIAAHVDDDNIAELLAKPRPEGSKVRWLCLEGLSVHSVTALAIHYQLHPLAVEDLVQQTFQSKIDFYDHHLHLSLVTLTESDVAEETTDHKPRHGCELPSPAPIHVHFQRCSIYLLRNNILVTIFQPSSGQLANKLQKYLDKKGTLLREREDAPMLLHAILDGLVDQCLPIVEKYGERIDELEQKVCDRKVKLNVAMSSDLHATSTELFGLRRAIAPLLRLTEQLMTHGVLPPDQPWLTHGTIVYLSNVKDNIIFCLEQIDSLSTQCKDLISLVFNLTSHETNITMKTLTMSSLIFLPLTFFAGIWGMNFEHMPELKWKWGYLMAWMVMAVGGAGFFAFAKFKVQRSLTRGS